MEITSAMAAKLKNSVQDLYLQHRRASVRCDEWAEKAIRYRLAGEWRKAERAEVRTFQCLTRMKRLEERWNSLHGLGATATLH
jgi:hypothetical protein